METNKQKSRLIPACAMFLSSSLVMSAMMTSVKTVAVYDEGRKTVVYTASADPARAVKLAGLELAADDEISAWTISPTALAQCRSTGLSR